MAVDQTLIKGAYGAAMADSRGAKHLARAGAISGVAQGLTGIAVDYLNQKTEDRKYYDGLAQKVLELTKCEDCSSKCSDKLVIAQKLFLYMESIRTLLSQLGSDININQGIISQVLDTYNAAKAICAGNCGCNC